ncbi:MAG: methyltransferase domain-containing protein [Pyrinomonadaceae bacterium]|nr:methyltransferase domain-containing protein [Pyrinomonadaceae bacterium]
MSKQYEWDEAEGFAEFYERFFVPALFGDWGQLTVEAGSISPGEKVLDVACGTGVVARAARQRTDNVTGLDFSDDMLSVARNKDPSITWQKGSADALPFEDNSFDVVFCQFALMFFPDKVAALKELKRVGGRVVVAVWEHLDRTPGYREFVELLRKEFGDEPADILTSPFILGNKEELLPLFEEAGIEVSIETKETTAKFPSMEAWITTDVRATPLSAMFNDEALDQLIEFGREALGEYENEDGTISFPAPAHIVKSVV